MGEPSINPARSFATDLNNSLDPRDEPTWEAFYRRIWPGASEILQVDDRWKQKWGIDREIVMPSGRRITIDEKKRNKDWGDFLLEEWSVGHFSEDHQYQPKKVGWTLDPEKRCDFIAYYVEPARKCWLLPFELTRLAALRNLEAWKQVPNKYPKYAQTEDFGNYYTCNCAVPWKKLAMAIWNEMWWDCGLALK